MRSYHERPLWVVSGQSRETAVGPLLPVSQTAIFAGAARTGILALELIVATV